MVMTQYADIQRFERWLAEFDARTGELKDLVGRAEGYRRKGLQGELDKLLARRRKAGEHLAELKLADAESWTKEDLRSSLFTVFDEIGRRLDHLLDSTPR